ncbi:hypothetical protein [Burkholderia sp. NRF60-BP8]|uniref:hypothetical protein n=1 Tax=Burkholderia sp. NRF60-BP8 TaxID=1637853 RepID=UPI00075DDF8D|nr:hypothetical protein [Burkholderia sp. NRF60-BP8]AOI76077.1 hypothetical protein WS54_07190 [Burkholderia sp. NRF60-BP8]KVA07117.1 hypothetical protein WS54_23415 [Burkholderia sp. NRF60-BP8]
MSDRFRDYVTSTAFSLTLSRRQVEALCQLDQMGWCHGYLHTANALIGKGLCERAEDDGRLVFRLTEAGRAVIPMLKLAGLYEKFQFDREAV